jgi:hypothetical protein
LKLLHRLGLLLQRFDLGLVNLLQRFRLLLSGLVLSLLKLFLNDVALVLNRCDRWWTVLLEKVRDL